MVEVEKIDEMVGYQKQSVVSRTVIDKPQGTVTLFAFDEGEGLSEHTAPYDALVYVYDGKAVITISGKDYPVSKGETIIMPAGMMPGGAASSRRGVAWSGRGRSNGGRGRAFIGACEPPILEAPPPWLASGHGGCLLGVG